MKKITHPIMKIEFYFRRNAVFLREVVVSRYNEDKDINHNKKAVHSKCGKYLILTQIIEYGIKYFV